MPRFLQVDLGVGSLEEEQPGCQSPPAGPLGCCQPPSACPPGACQPSPSAGSLGGFQPPHQQHSQPQVDGV